MSYSTTPGRRDLPKYEVPQQELRMECLKLVIPDRGFVPHVVVQQAAILENYVRNGAETSTQEKGTEDQAKPTEDQVLAELEKRLGAYLREEQIQPVLYVVRRMGERLVEGLGNVNR